MAEWQPIETAPADYSVVLLYQPAGPGNAEAIGQGHRTDLRGHTHDKWIFQATGWRADPTHWMPMPAPPDNNDPGSTKGRGLPLTPAKGTIR